MLFLIEPGCVPIKNYWLDKLIGVSKKGEFWIIGSMYRGKSEMFWKNNLQDKLHINGNAIYNTSQNGFPKFYQSQIIEKLGSKRFQSGYDMLISRYIFSNIGIKLNAPMYYIYTKIISNLCEQSKNVISEQSSDTYLVRFGNGKIPELI